MAVGFLACSYHDVVVHELGMNVLDSAVSIRVAGDCMKLDPCGKTGNMKLRIASAQSAEE